MPPSTMMETTPPNNEPKKKDHSLRIDESTKKRLAQRQMERKKNESNSSFRRSFLNESIGKWTEPQTAGKPVKKKKPTDELSGLSNHGQPRPKNNYGLSKSDHARPIKKKYVEKRASTHERNDGKLGNMLAKMDETQPRKKRDARTVATMPATRTKSVSSAESPRGRSPGPIKKHYPRSQSQGPVKKHYPRSQSPGPIQKHYPRSQSPAAQRSQSPAAQRSQSPASRLDETPYRPIQKRYVSPAKRRSTTPEARRSTTPETRRSTTPETRSADNTTPIKKRSASPAPIKKRSASPAPVKKRSSVGPGKKHSTTALARRPDDSDDNAGKLGKMLDGMEAEKPRKKGARSVASAPSKPMRKDRDYHSSRGDRSTASSRGERTSVPKKSKSTSSRGDDTTSPRRVRRSKSADDVDLGMLEEHLNMTEEDRAARNERASRRRESKRTKAERSDRSADTSTTLQGDSGSVEHDRRSQLSKRSNSMGPRVTVPSNQKETEDRRAAMKRHRSMQNGTDHQQDEPPRPTRAQSMMLHREATRRGGKSSSLADLVQYSEEEIHSTSYFASNHVLVNRERMKRGLRPLTRNIAMDELARENAKAMAETAGVAPIRATYVGNVLRGESIRAIHRSTMQQKQGRERANLLNPYFQDFGVGTAKGKDGMLYMCQLFSERLELTCADTAAPPS